MVWKPIKCILRLTTLFTNKINGSFQLDCVTLYCFYDAHLTILPLNRLITTEFTKGVFHENVNFQHALFVNNNHYITYSSTNSRCESTNDQLNSKTNHLINNSIKNGELANSEIATLNYMMHLLFKSNKVLLDIRVLPDYFLCASPVTAFLSAVLLRLYFHFLALLLH